MFDLVYNQNKKVITYLQYEYDKEDGFFTNKTKKINLKLKKGKLHKK